MELSPNELRIGNWVSRLDDTTFQIDKLDIFELDDYPHYLRPKPIPLTEEWLIKFGFDKAGINVFRWYKKSGRNYHTFHLNQKSSIGTFYYSRSRIQINYVHQFQNLYFALTGEELTIKELVK